MLIKLGSPVIPETCKNIEGNVENDLIFLFTETVGLNNARKNFKATNLTKPPTNENN